MRLRFAMPVALLVASMLLWALPAAATDVDGDHDCRQSPSDWGDAPEGIPAYPGVLAAFPTCLTAGPIGTQTQSGACPLIGSPPGPAGFIRHAVTADESPYWLGCGPNESGVDSEIDGKVNANGGPTSDCNPNVGVDCFETAFGLTFGQDECYGSDDAGLGAPVDFTACAIETLSVSVYLCGTSGRDVFVNVLVDWNEDGDWNDSFDCGAACAPEWAIRNMPVTLVPGCNKIMLPVQAGPNAGNGWMRITIANDFVTVDFPWAGSSFIAGGSLHNGETEDYPVTISNPTGGGCPGFEDFGDAPEGTAAYTNGTIGAFPTCIAPGPVGTPNSTCPPPGSPPGPAGYVRHVNLPPDPVFWLGCGNPGLGTVGVDAEPDGKTNDNGTSSSACDPAVAVDCFDATFPSLTFGQDECLAAPDGDAGLVAQPNFMSCTYDSVVIQTYNCDLFEYTPAYLNVLIDMNEDGDWNDTFLCPGGCAVEWALQNVQVMLPPGCSQLISPAFLIGPNAGESWMRISLSSDPVGLDFPWNGTLTAAGPDFVRGGETEDYPVTISGPDTCQVAYEDFGDAPEGNTAYASGVAGFFPTCLNPGQAGTQEIECEAAISTPPGATGYVKHVALATDPVHFWLGCALGASPLLAVDSERDGKTNTLAPFGGPSYCDPAVSTDCIESGLVGIGVNQDECVGDLDAGMRMPTYFKACSTAVFEFDAFNCASNDIDVVLNVLVDFNHDGDWNDNLLAACGVDTCANEWAIKNEILTLVPGCGTYTTSPFSTGPVEGRSWLRITLTQVAVPDDFPWNGSAGTAAGYFEGGETEDHPVNILPRTTDVDGTPLAGGLWFAPPRPNPARDRVTFRFALPADGPVSLAIFDLFGRRVADVTGGTQNAGAHTATWDFRGPAGETVPPGVYLAKLTSHGETLTRAVIRVR